MATKPAGGAAGVLFSVTVFQSQQCLRDVYRLRTCELIRGC